MALSLGSLTKNCGTPVVPGTKTKLYITIDDELAAWPQTQKEITEAAMGTPVAGDSKRLGEAFDFTGAGSGLGYWRVIDILVDSGDLAEAVEGEIGGQGVRQRLTFTILGYGPVQKEFVDCIVSYSGCLIPMIPDKNGVHHVLGNLENPCFVETGEGGTGGERSGYTFTLFANTGFTSYTYDADTLGIDLTPEA